jgi:HEAT repeat protein
MPRARELLLLVVLLGLLAYLYVPLPRWQPSDPVGRQLSILRYGAAPDRNSAVVELARMADTDAPRIIKALIQAVADPDAQVRLAAVGGLHVVSPDDPMVNPATSALIPALTDSDPRVCATAAGILSKFKPPTRGTIAGLIAAARAVDPPQASPAPADSRAAAATSVQASIDRAQRRHARAAAVTALGVLAPGDAEVQKAIIGLADDEMTEVRVAVAEALPLASSDRRAAFATEIKLASDSDEFVRSVAITSLGGFPENYVDSCPLLYRAWLTKQKPLVDGAQVALAKLTTAPTFDAAKAARSEEAPLRLAAAFLRSPNSDEGLQALASALKDKDPGVRQMAAARLGTVSSRRAPAALQALEAVTAETDTDARVAILRSINLLKPRPSQSTP